MERLQRDPCCFTELRGDSGKYMENGFGADGMNPGVKTGSRDNVRQVRLLQRKRFAAAVRSEVCVVRHG